jgi:hypothetical protein
MQEKNWWRLPALAIAFGIVGLALATYLLLQGVEPFATWFYNFAWYPVLIAGDGVVALVGGAGRGKKGEFILFGRKNFTITVLFWSAVVWLFYEVFNFRLQNWYYVNLPIHRADRWAGTVIAFATVLPAVFVAEGIFRGINLAEGVRWPTFRVTNKVISGMRIAGIIMLALVLLWPKYFFPLVWGATMLLVEPENYRRSKEHSLLADLEAGKPGRLLRLLAGGALIGFTWEMLNIKARGKWIYTVPGVEELKLFEMPIPGFIGFPPFSVECFILWQSLLLSGLAVPRWGPTIKASTAKRATAAVGAVVFSVGTLLGMEQLTNDSTKPMLYGYDAFRLAKLTPEVVSNEKHVSQEEAQKWIEEARIATLRGIGTDNLRALQRVGVNSMEQLANQNWATLDAALEKDGDREYVDARVRVWIRGARRYLEKHGSTNRNPSAPAGENADQASAKSQ